MSDTRSFTLKIWRQNGSKNKGYFETFDIKDVDVNASFLELFLLIIP